MYVVRVHPASLQICCFIQSYSDFHLPSLGLNTIAIVNKMYRNRTYHNDTCHIPRLFHLPRTGTPRTSPTSLRTVKYAKCCAQQGVHSCVHSSWRTIKKIPGNRNPGTFPDGNPCLHPAEWRGTQRDLPLRRVRLIRVRYPVLSSIMNIFLFRRADRPLCSA